ncbi:hypothetical protein R6Q59_026332 [Mikania micrantha]
MMDVVLLISYLWLGFDHGRFYIGSDILLERLLFYLQSPSPLCDCEDDLAISAILTNIQSSLSSFLVIFMAHAADSYVGRFHALLLSNTAYIGVSWINAFVVVQSIRCEMACCDLTSSLIPWNIRR